MQTISIIESQSGELTYEVGEEVKFRENTKRHLTLQVNEFEMQEIEKETTRKLREILNNNWQ